MLCHTGAVGRSTNSLPDSVLSVTQAGHISHFRLAFIDTGAVIISAQCTCVTGWMLRCTFSPSSGNGTGSSQET